MKRYSWIVVVGTLLLIASLAGFGLVIYQAGMAQGAAAGMETSDMVHPFVWARPLLTGLLAILLLVFLLRLAAHLILFPLFGPHWPHRFSGFPMHAPWRQRMAWDHEREIPDFIKQWHERLHQEDPSAEVMDTQD